MNQKQAMYDDLFFASVLSIVAFATEHWVVGVVGLLWLALRIYHITQEKSDDS